MADLQAEGSRIEGALRAAEAIADPVERYRALDGVHDQLVALAAAVRIAQGAALDELRPAPWQEIADRVGVRNYQYVQKLVNAARAAQREEQQ